MMVTLKEIASQVGVSTQLVSAVLRGSSAGRVSTEKYNRIMEVVSKTNYRPNHVARALKEKKTWTIGLIISDIDSPFHSNLTSEMLKVTQKRGYKLMLMVSNWNRELDLSCLEQLMDNQVDGIMMCGFALRRDDAAFVRLLDEKKPFVQIGGHLSEFPNITFDFMSGFDAAFKFLCESGHRRIAMADADTDKRIAYVECCRKYQIEAEIFQYEFPFIGGYEQVIECGRRIGAIKQLPDALIIGSDECAALIMNGLAENDIMVPRDVSIISNDNTYINSLIHPALTVIELNRTEMAIAAMESLMDQLENKNEYKLKNYDISSKLIIRDSVIERHKIM